MYNVVSLSEQDGVKKVSFNTTLHAFNVSVCGLVVAFYSSQQCVVAVHLPALNTKSKFYDELERIMQFENPDKILIFTRDVTTMFSNDDDCVDSYYTNARTISEYCPHNTHYYVPKENSRSDIVIYIDSQGDLPTLTSGFKKIDFYI